MPHLFLTGAAGFIGSHLSDRLLAAGHMVSAADSFVRGARAHLAEACRHPRFQLFESDLSQSAACRHAFSRASARAPIDAVWHLAANSDIAAGVADPAIDLRDTFLTTFHTLACMREFRIPSLAFASSSAVYGDHREPLHEDLGPMLPISSYGAMKLASEALISSAVESFLERAWIFRFPNVVGGRATHGVIYDLLRKLERNPAELEVLGDGRQQKPYLHVSELLDAMFFITEHARERRNCFNIAGDEAGATVRFIAETVVNTASPGAAIRYTGGKGWVGDVPSFRYSTARLARLGWRPRLRSEEAVTRAAAEIHAQWRAAPCRP